jgi:hypothetical protein
MRLLMLSAFLLGCKTVTPLMAVPTPLRTAPLSMLGLVPTVEVEVRGQKTQCLVDTGAPQTVLLAGFARSLGVQLQKTEEAATGAEGQTLAVERTDTLAMRVAGGELAERWAVVEAPDLEGKGVGCVLAPQRLTVSGAVILDFPKRQLHVFAGTMDGWLRWLDDRSPKGAIESLPRVGASEGPLFVNSHLGNGSDAVTRVTTGNAGCRYVQAVVEGQQVQNGVVTAPLRASGLVLPPTTCSIVESLGGPQGQWGAEVFADYVLLLPLPGPQLWVTKPPAR